MVTGIVSSTTENVPGYRILVTYQMTDSPSGNGGSNIHGVAVAIKGEDDSDYTVTVSAGKTASCHDAGIIDRGEDFEFNILGGYIAFSGSTTCGVAVEVGFPNNGATLTCESTTEYDVVTRFSEYETDIEMLI